MYIQRLSFTLQLRLRGPRTTECTLTVACGSRAGKKLRVTHCAETLKQAKRRTNTVPRPDHITNNTNIMYRCTITILHISLAIPASHSR